MRGGILDPDTFLYHFGARDYDPFPGRWLEKDPILFKGGETSLYGYASADPINFIDPSGLILGEVIADAARLFFKDATKQEAALSGKILDSVGGPLGNILSGKNAGTTSCGGLLQAGIDVYEAYSGIQSISLGNTIATASAESGAGAVLEVGLPITLAAAGGVSIGLGINALVEDTTGESIGSHIYDWIH